MGCRFQYHPIPTPAAGSYFTYIQRRLPIIWPFGQYFYPITSLITVENGGGYSEEMITVEIPVQAPPDHFAMGLLYDVCHRRSWRACHWWPCGSNSVTMAHVTFLQIDGECYCQFGSRCSGMKTDINSGFKPGVDDWQFANCGSYIAPGGHCAGQSLSACGISANNRMAPERTSTVATIKMARNPGPCFGSRTIPSVTDMASCSAADINWNSFAE